MFFRWLKVSLLLWTVFVCAGQSQLEVRLESVKNIAGEEETLAVFKFRLLGKERLLNGTLTLLVDLDENYVGTGDVFSFKNGEWVPSNFKVRTKPCDLVTNYLRYYYLSPNADTNFPFGGDNGMKKGEYYFKKIAIAVDNWPTFLSRGPIKIVVSMKSLEGKIVGGYEVISTVVAKIILRKSAYIDFLLIKTNK